MSKRNNVERKPTVRALLIIDVQNDFIHGGLAVPDAESIIPVINRLRSKAFDHIYMCLDWHPFNHCSFRNNNPGSQVLNVIHLPSTGDPQVMWPDHCVQGTTGAELHKDLATEASDIYTYAGCNPQRDSYSVFKDNGSSVLTDMRDLLEQNQVTEIYAVGLATDYCVQYTVLDAKVLLKGTDVEVFFIEDGCRGIDQASIASAHKKFEFEKIHIIRSDGDVINKLADRKPRVSGKFLNPRPLGWSDAVFPDVDDLYECLIFQCWDDGIRKLQACIDAGNINRLCSWSCKSVLHACCETGNLEVLALLLELGKDKVDVTARSKKEENALMFAVQCKKRHLRPAMIKMLIEFATEEQQRELIFGQTRLSRMTALMYACRDGDSDTVEALLSYESGMHLLQICSAFGKTAIMYCCMSESPEHAASVELLLRSQTSVDDRIALLAQRDFEAWNSLHLGAKSGCFAGIDWSRCLNGYDNASKLPINAVTNSGITFLHLAAFNGKSEVVRSILDSHSHVNKKRNLMQAILRKGLRHKLQVNVRVRSTGDTELDLAIQRRHIECARLLLRLGCHAGNSKASEMHELLHRLVLMGDVEACENILNYADENRITVDDTLVEMTQRMEHPETCTFSFAGYNNSITQYVYTCSCGQTVCLVCKDRCHNIHTCRKNLSILQRDHMPEFGWSPQVSKNTHCECNRETCCATDATDAREREGYRFLPNPISTASVEVDAELVQLSRKIARNNHNVWALAKVEQGWQYARDKDEDAKLHPHLLPFSSLSYDGSKYNVDMALEAVKVIHALGYTLAKKRTGTSSGKSRIGTATTPFGLDLKRASPPSGAGGSAIATTASAAASDTAATTKAGALAHVSPKSPGLPNHEGIVKMLLSAPSKSAATDRKRKTRAEEARASKYSDVAWRKEVPECAIVDTSAVVLPERLQKLVRLLATNSHEVWAAEKIRQCFRYAPARNIKRGLKLNSSLVPYHVLNAHEKAELVRGAEETIKLILHYGWEIEGEPNAEPEEGGQGEAGDHGLERRHPEVRRSSFESHKQQHNFAARQLKTIRRKLFNQYLFAAVRRGQIDSVNILLSKRTSMHAGANLNAIDEFGHTPLYIAVKRGHFEVARRLLHLGANVEIRDINGLTPLAMCAYLGNLRLCQELVQNSAHILVCDKMGYTPLHHAAYQGHVNVCKYLTERLQQEHQTNDIVDINANANNLLAGQGVPEARSPAAQTESKQAEGTPGLSSGPTVGVFRSLVKATMNKKTLSKINPMETTGAPSSVRARMMMGRGSTKPIAEAEEPPERGSTPRVTPRGSARSDMSTPRFSIMSESSDGTHIRASTQRHTDNLAELELAPFSPLSLAVVSNNPEVVEALIKFGGNPMKADGKKEMGGELVSPYKRALFRHIEMLGKVEFLQEQLSRRAMLEMSQQHQEESGGANPRNRKVAPRKSVPRDGTSLMLHNNNNNNNNNNHSVEDGISHDAGGVGGAPTGTSEHTTQQSMGRGRGLQLQPFGKRLKLIRKADSRLTNFFGFNSRNDEKQINLAASTRELDEILAKAQRECQEAARMVDIINHSAKVRIWRKNQAMRMFMKEAVILLLMICIFLFAVPLSPGYSLSEERIWANAVRDHLRESTGDLTDEASFFTWLEQDFVGRSLRRTHNRTTLLSQNKLFGGLSLTVTTHYALRDDFDEVEGYVDQNDVVIEPVVLLPLSEDVQVVKDVVRAAADKYLSQGGIVQLKLEFNLYNSIYEVYGVAYVVYTTSFFGVPHITTEVLPYRINYYRFPPSRMFQFVLLGMLALFCSFKFRSWLTRRGNRRGRKTEWITGILMVGILILDMYIFELTKDISPDFQSSEQISLLGVQRLVEVERRTFAVYFFLSMIPLLNAARTIPSIGPVVVALLNTMTHSAVLIYLMVVATACFLLAFTFEVGFGASVHAFSDTFATFRNLFLTPYIESWNIMADVEEEGSLGSVLSIFYILFSTITINLLIAIVTDVYPSARKASDSLWEEIITVGIEEKLKASVHGKGANKEALQIEYWTPEVLLSGKDGVKKWERKDEEQRQRQTRVEDEQLTQLQKELAGLRDLVKQLATAATPRS